MPVTYYDFNPYVSAWLRSTSREMATSQFLMDSLNPNEHLLCTNPNSLSERSEERKTEDGVASGQPRVTV